MGRPSTYPAEFRTEAVELVNSSDRSIAEVARSLGISDSTLSSWINAERRARERAADPDGLSETERAELTRLRRKNTELRSTGRSCARPRPISGGRRCGEPPPLRR